MRNSSVTLAALAVLALGAWATGARAEDTVRLFRPEAADAATLTLGYSGGEDTELVHGKYWRGYYGGWRGYYGGFRGFYGGFYGRPYWGYSARPYYGYYARPYWGFAYARPYYYPRYATFSYGFSYYRPAYYYGGYYCPISATIEIMPRATVLGTAPAAPSSELPPPVPAKPAPPPGPVPMDRTYPYDGGPANPVPMPQTDPTRRTEPPPATVPLEGRLVSVPAKTKYAYPAYGEQPGRTTGTGTSLVKTPVR
jgi:hypothetical protein